MSILGTFTKQPVEKVDFDIDFTDWLTQGDDVMQANVASEPAGLTITKVTVSSPIVKIWTSGGTDGVTYKITATASTDDGRVKQCEFKVKVKEA